jgi:hypothetical protein
MPVNKEKFPYKIGDCYYSDLQVLNNGPDQYFIGRLCWVNDPIWNDGGYVDMGSRESNYYPSQEMAEKAMKYGFAYRNCPENEPFLKLCQHVPIVPVLLDVTEI